VPAALRVRFLRAACPACWLLDMSRLIASWMVFRAQGASPASCARELGLNPAAPMLQHILNIWHLKFFSCSHTEAGPGFLRRGWHRLPNTTYRRPPATGRMLPAVFSPLLQLSSGYCNLVKLSQPSLVITRGACASPGCSNQGHVQHQVAATKDTRVNVRSQARSPTHLTSPSPPPNPASPSASPSPLRPRTTRGLPQEARGRGREG
jgi:hypothetical protein